MAEPILNNQANKEIINDLQGQQLLDVFQRGLGQIRDSIKAGVDVNTPNWAAADFLTLSASTALDNERVLIGTANQIVLTDAGAGSTLTLSTPQDLDTGATIQFAQLTLTGRYFGTEMSSNPNTTDLTSLAAFAMYMKSDKFVIAYNNAGTMTYISIPMNGSTATWTNSTTAP